MRSKILSLGRAIELLELGYKLVAHKKSWHLVKADGSEWAVDGRVGWNIENRRPDLVTLESDVEGVKTYKYDPKPRMRWVRIKKAVKEH